MRPFRAGDEIVEREPMPDDAVLAVLRIRDAEHDRFVVLDVQGDHLLVASIYTKKPVRLRLAAEFVHADLAEVDERGTVAVSADAWGGLGWDATGGPAQVAEVLDLGAARVAATVRRAQVRAARGERGAS